MLTPEEVFARFAARFPREGINGLRAVYQLCLTGDGGGEWHMMVGDQKCELAQGRATQPDISITMATRDWEALTSGRLDLLSAYMAGRIQVEGDLSLVMKLQGLFDL